MTGRGWMGVALVAGLLLHLAGTIVESRRESALLRADPDAVSRDPALTGFAVALAKPAYAAHCARCHGPDLEGDRTLGAAKLAGGDRLYGSGLVSEIERVLYYGIRSGHPKAWNLAEMPAFGRPQPASARYRITPLTPPEIGDLVEYLIALGGHPADRAAADRGRTLFAGKGACYDCHSADAKGDQAIGAPNLTGSVWLYGDGSRDGIFRSIAHGRAGVCPAWIGRLSPATLRALAVYVHVRSHHE